MIIPRLVGTKVACGTCRRAVVTQKTATAAATTLARSSSAGPFVGRSVMASSRQYQHRPSSRSTVVSVLHIRLAPHQRRRTLATEGGGGAGGGGHSIRGGPGPGPSGGGQQQHAVPTSTRGPVSWTSLGLAAVASAAAVGYFKIQRERRLEEAMGKVVTSESPDGYWSPDPDTMAPRRFRRDRAGRWMPEVDALGDSGRPAIGGPWTLIDLDGKLVSEKTFRGKYTLLYFGFARCPDICPSEMVKVAKIMDTLKSQNPDLAAKIQPLFVTVDPARDSIRTLREYGKDFHPSYKFLTGTPEQIQKMAKSYRVYVSKADETDDGDYLVDHSIVLYFHDDKGDLLDVYTQSMKPSDVVEKIVGGIRKASQQTAAS